MHSVEYIMKKIFIIHENEEWVDPLEKELKIIDAPYEKWHMNSKTIDMSTAPPLGVFYNRMSASSHTRGHRYAPEYTATVLDWLEYHNRRVINNSKALNLELSKSLQYKELKKEGIKVPETIFAKGKEQIINLGKNFRLPFLIKHNRAGKGLGIKLFKEYKSFEESILNDEFIESVDGITLIQEYIKSKTKTIIRTEFIDSEFLYAVQVDTSGGFELCPADTCNLKEEYCPGNATGNKFMILENFNNPVIKKYIKLLKNNDIEIAGIEFIEDENGQIFTYDINTNTNYNSIAESLIDLKGMRTISSFLFKELSKIS